MASAIHFGERLWHDTKYSARSLSRSWTFTLTAALAIALGIAATSSVFSVIYAIFVDPFPYRGSDRLCNVTLIDRSGKPQNFAYTKSEFVELRQSSRTLEDVMAQSMDRVNLRAHIPKAIWGVQLSTNGFDFLGVPAEVGRTFRERDFSPNGEPDRVAVLGHDFWMLEYQGRKDVLGKTLIVADQPYTVIGVLPVRFTWLDGDVYMPMRVNTTSQEPVWTVMKRKKEFTLSQAAEELQAFNLRFAKRNPQWFPAGEFHTRVRSVIEWLTGGFGKGLWTLFLAVGLLLLIACANVAILLLARGSTRVSEFAVRAAVGADRSRLIQQLLTESTLIALTGGALGLALAYPGVRGIAGMLPYHMFPREAVISVNGPVLAFTFFVCVAVGILFGIVPALRLVRRDVAEALQSSGKGTDSRTGGGRFRNGLVVLQFALTLMLMVGSSLAMRGFARLADSSTLGYNPHGVLTGGVSLPTTKYKTWSAAHQFLKNATERVREISGVQSVTINSLTLPPWSGWSARFQVGARPSEPNETMDVNLIGADYLRVLQTPLLAGRSLNDSDIEGFKPVAIINKAAALRYWKTLDAPLGDTITLPQLRSAGMPMLQPPHATSSFQIVGVAENMRNNGLTKTPVPAAYLPYSVALFTSHSLLVRASGDPKRLEESLRRKILAADPDMAVSDVLSLDDFAAKTALGAPRFSAVLFTLFAGIGLLLAVTGIYGVLTYTISHRKRELGIRMAIGASRGDILILVVGLVLQLVGTGILVGLAGSFALSRVFGSQFEGVRFSDPLAFAAVVLTLTSAALLASLIPVRRATSVEPMVVLRYE